ncbi:hypothetical protein [Azospirillum picis]|uniref:Uncharacterized protein n=1 Tax=Azospirillum picis TaxID=488438 RepID=A0ABU0MRU0_9PROT|nr:hypothetical protein [Azospirillum picis]MBP2302559.1 hypothetical protein [Azospirillum picis]MDQ0536199.1 hypothetical protein [Azospirillum picis]
MEWKLSTFGRSTPIRQMARATEELGELFRAITSDAAPEKIVIEAADVALILADIGVLLGTADWLFGARPPRISRPVRLVTYTVTQLGLLAHEVEMISSGDAGRSQSMALSALRAVIGALQELVGCYGHDLKLAIDAKMAINRGRKWTLDGTGHGYHQGAI